MAKRIIKLTLILDEVENVSLGETSLEEIKRDLEREINCASHSYEIVDIEEIR